MRTGTMSRISNRRKNAYKELVKVLGWSRHDQPLSSTEELQEAPKPEPVPIGYPRFTEGKCYKIWGGSTSVKYSYTNDSRYCFRYEGKRGIHHCFREVRGDWTRTYTDAQLIGKKIEEAVECPTKQ